MSTFDQAGTGQIPAVKKVTVAAEGSPDLQPTAITFPAALMSVRHDVECCIGTIATVLPTAPESSKEMLVNSATALLHIAEMASGALGMLARAGIKPLEPAPTSPTIPECAA